MPDRDATIATAWRLGNGKVNLNVHYEVHGEDTYNEVSLTENQAEALALRLNAIVGKKRCLLAEKPAAWYVTDCGSHEVYVAPDHRDNASDDFALTPSDARELAAKLLDAANTADGVEMAVNPDVRKAVILTVPQGEFFEDNYDALVRVIEAAAQDGDHLITITAQSKYILEVNHNTKHTFGDQ
jgi:hypothetical protein